MKSLVESLFDDNVSKELTFGNLYKLIDCKVWKPNRTSSIGRNWDASKLYNYKQIAFDSGVKLSDVDDSIGQGLAKLIMNIPVGSGMSIKEFNSRLGAFEKYYKSIVNSTKRLRARSLPYAYRKDGKSILDFGDDFAAYRAYRENWMIGEPKEIKVELCSVELMFEKK